MNTSYIKILVGLVFFIGRPFYAFPQELNQTKADSIYSYYTEEKTTDYQLAIPVLQKAIAFYKQKMNDCRVSRLSRKLADCFETVGRIDSALSILLNAERQALRCDYTEQAGYYMDLTGIYITLEDYDRAIQLVDEIQGKWPENAPDSIISELASNKAIALVFRGDVDEAKQIFKRIYRDLALRGKRKRQIYLLNNLAALYGMSGDLDSAAHFLELALPICRAINCETQLDLWQNLATLASQREQYELSLLFLDSAMTQARSTKNLILETALLREKALATSKTGEIERAFDYLILHSSLQDSLFSKQMAEAVANYQERYESEKQAGLIDKLQIEKLDSDLREATLKQTRNIILVVGVAVVLLAFGLWRRLKHISNTKAIIEAERNRADELLLNILPQEVAQELKEKGRAEAKEFEMVSILFTDFKGFTTASEKLSAQDLVAEINTCFEAFDGLMEKHGVEKIKTIGDAYMAASGLSKSTIDSVRKTVLAALEIQDFIIQRQAKQNKKGGPAFEMRAGIHTGPVVAGIVGVKKFQYDIWGDTVNIASRMESSGAVSKVNISQTTYELLKHDPDFTFESRGKIQAKGKGEIEMYFVSKA